MIGDGLEPYATVAAIVAAHRQRRARIMFDLAHRALAALLFALTMFSPAPAQAQSLQEAQLRTDGRPAIQRRIPERAKNGALPFARTELYFGTAKPEGAVTEAEFREFVDQFVTPRFPDGL